MGGGKLEIPDSIGLDATVDVDPITMDLNTYLLGSKDEPIAMMVLGDREAPITVEANMGMDTSIRGSKEEPVAMMMLGDQEQPVSAHISGDKDRPIAMAMEMTNLPRFSVEDIKEILKPRMKISLPGHRQLCLKILGQELFSICYGGEGQFKIEPLNPDENIDCHIPFCDVDTRPFPEKGLQS